MTREGPLVIPMVTTSSSHHNGAKRKSGSGVSQPPLGALVLMKRRVLIIVQNLPVPFDRRVWLECQALVSAGYRVAVVCPKGKGDPSYEVVDTVRLYKYRPYAPGGSSLRSSVA